MAQTFNDLLDPVESTKITVACGYKYILQEQFFYRIREPLPFRKEYFGNFWAIYTHRNDWWCTGYTGCGYDGPSGPLVFDWDYLMPGSFVHDVGHWCIRLGILPESANDMIDKELAGMVRRGKAKIPWFIGGERTRPSRAFIVEKGTNLVNGHFNEPLKIRSIPV